MDLRYAVYAYPQTVLLAPFPMFGSHPSLTLAAASPQQPGPGWTPVLQMVVRVSWQPLPTCPTHAIDDDRPQRQD